MKINNVEKLFRLLFVISFLTVSSKSFAQTQTVKDLQKDASRKIKKGVIDSSKIWNTGGIFTLNLGQASQNNWAAGGDNFSFSVAAYVGVYAFYKKDRWSWDNTLDLNYGMVNTSSLGTRKNDDRIDFLSKGGYGLTPKLDLAGVFNFHSQFTKGYDYKSDGSKTLLSDFMAPAYILLGIGLNYKPATGLSIFISPLTSRWIIVNNDTLSAKGAYGVAPGKKVKNEIGAYASITYLKDLSKTITYNGRLDLFSNYEHNPQNVAIMMNNMFTAKISKILSASLGLNLIYDDDVKLFGTNHDSPGLQTQSLIAVGLSVKL
ncbi:MAG: DUF3078 domain-containing protein [Ginsengibacter sp.]